MLYGATAQLPKLTLEPLQDRRNREGRVRAPHSRTTRESRAKGRAMGDDSSPSPTGPGDRAAHVLMLEAEAVEARTAGEEVAATAKQHHTQPVQKVATLVTGAAPPAVAPVDARPRVAENTSLGPWNE